MSPASEEQEFEPGDQRSHRPVRSFVLRAGRLTEAQKRALGELWPEYGLEPDESGMDFRSIFGNDRPVVMEIGFGNGDATWQMAQHEPHKNFLGVEVHRPGVGHLLLKLQEHGLKNVRVVCRDAVDVLEEAVPPASLSEVRIYFPDPWPKKRHHKRRIVQAGFIELLADRIRPGGLLHLATDWAPYAEWMLDVIQQSPKFENLASDGRYCSRPDWRPGTKYERRGERLGHEVFDILLRRSETF